MSSELGFTHDDLRDLISMFPEIRDPVTNELFERMRERSKTAKYNPDLENETGEPK